MQLLFAYFVSLKGPDTRKTDKTQPKHMKKNLIIAGLTLVLSVNFTLNAAVWSVKDFGATGDGVSKDTEAIQAAIDAAHKAGGGTVELPAGTYLSGSIILKDNIDFHIAEGAILVGSPNLEDYCPPDSFKQNYSSPRTSENISGGHLICCVESANVTLRGPGKIDGNSRHFFLHGNYVDVGKKVTLPDRPGQMIWFADCSRVRIYDLEITGAPYWSCFLHNCSEVWIRGCKVYTESDDYVTHNGDGIDIDRCRFVHISDCHIDTHDDCITLRASGAERLASPQNCEYVTVSNCTLSSECNAIRLGVGEGLIREATFSNLCIYNSQTAFNIVSGYSRNEQGASIEGIRFCNIRVEAERLMKIHHMRGEGSFKDIEFDGISGNVKADSQIWAKKDYPFEDISLRNIDIRSGYECINADVRCENCNLWKIRLGAKVLKERKTNIEIEKKLLY